MNINETLISYLENENPLKEEYINNQMVAFLKASIPDKQKLAEELAANIVKRHNKDKLAVHIAELYEVESATILLTGKRDHAVHALNTFILGLFINDRYLNGAVNLFEWKLAALFHDIAYPLEISQNIINRYFQKMSEIVGDTFSRSNPTINLEPRNLIELSNNISALNLLQSRISEWNINVDTVKEYEKMTSNNRINHGIISSLTILYLIDKMYQKNNPEREHKMIEVDGSDFNQDYFEKEIVSACSTIFLHALRPTDFFSDTKNNSELAYLLKLCDELQNWDRPTKDFPEGDSAENYEIEIHKEKLIFRANDKEIGRKIKAETECLNDKELSIE